MTAELGRTDRVSRFVRSPSEDVFRAFEDGATLMRWMPPSGMTGRALDYDFRVGGRYRIELRYSGGSGAGKTTGDSDVSTGEFVEIVSDERIRQTVRFESEDPELAAGMTVTWTFAPAPEGTEVTVTAEGVPAAISREDHLKGLRGSLDNLADFVERG